MSNNNNKCGCDRKKVLNKNGNHWIVLPVKQVCWLEFCTALSYFGGLDFFKHVGLRVWLLYPWEKYDTQLALKPIRYTSDEDLKV
jgi:hypothetical protein